MELARALDPVALFSDAMGHEPDDWQRDLLRSDADRILLNCSRQSGKSTTCAVLALHCAMYTPGSLVLLLSPSLRQSGELFRKVVDAFNTLDRPVPATAESALRLELENGSRIVSLPGNSDGTVRGYSGVNLLVVDEASRTSDELFHAAKPMLAVSRGRLVCLSTPYGQRGFFYREWSDTDASWHRVRVTALECPRIDPTFLVEERRSMGEHHFRQEYHCEFAEASSALFSSADISGLFVEGLECW